MKALDRLWHILTHVDHPMDMPFEVVEHYSTEQPMSKKTPKKKTAKKRPAGRKQVRYIALDTDDAAEILQKLDSGSDPVWKTDEPCESCGQENPEPTELTPDEIADRYPGEDVDCHWITYRAEGGVKVHGTLRDMIIDRITTTIEE